MLQRLPVLIHSVSRRSSLALARVSPLAVMSGWENFANGLLAGGWRVGLSVWLMVSPWRGSLSRPVGHARSRCNDIHAIRGLRRIMCLSQLLKGTDAGFRGAGIVRP